MHGGLTGSVNQINIYSFSLDQEMSFKAFLTDFGDQFTSNWNSQEIYGRMDPIYTYKNTTRKITLAFDVPSTGLESARRHNYFSELLINALYPVYEDKDGRGTATIASPPLFRIKFANLISRADKELKTATAKEAGLLGWIDAFNFKPELDSGLIVEQENNMIYPKLYKVSFGFNVIHEHPLGAKIDGESHKPRILNNSITKNNFAHGFQNPQPSRQPQQNTPVLGEAPIPFNQVPAAAETRIPLAAGAQSYVSAITRQSGSATIPAGGGN